MTSLARDAARLALALTLCLTGAAAAAELPPIVRAPAPPHDDAPDDGAIQRARAAYDAASSAFYSGRVADALPHALAAWRALPNASSSLIVATVHAELGHPCDALGFALVSALDPTPEEAEQARRLRVEQGPRCGDGFGWLDLRVDASDAWVDIGGVRLDAPASVGVGAGSWDISAGAPGRATSRRTIDVGPGEGRSVYFALGAVAATASTVVELPSETVASSETSTTRPGEGPQVHVLTDRGAEDDDAAAVGSLIGGGVALVASGVLLRLSLDEIANGEAIIERAGPAPSDADRSALAASHDRTRDLEVAGWVAGGVGVVALTVGVVLLATADEGPADAAPPALGIGVGPDGAAVLLGGRF